MSDELLDRATRALAQETEAHPEPADDDTLAQILGSIEEAKTKPDMPETRSWLSWAAAAALIVAGFTVGPTAWAWSVEALENLLGSAPSAPEEGVEPPSAASEVERQDPRRRSRASVEPAELSPPEPIPTEPIPTTEAVPSETAPARPTALGEAPARARRQRRAPTSSPEPASEATPTEPELDPAIRAERELFETAHRLHFGGAGREAVLSAWDGYLSRYPAGRYAPEARYNRALTLVRLNQTEAAQAALEDLARRGYRESDVRALLDAMESP